MRPRRSFRSRPGATTGEVCPFIPARSIPKPIRHHPSWQKGRCKPSADFFIPLPHEMPPLLSCRTIFSYLLSLEPLRKLEKW